MLDKTVNIIINKKLVYRHLCIKTRVTYKCANQKQLELSLFFVIYCKLVITRNICPQISKLPLYGNTVSTIIKIHIVMLCMYLLNFIKYFKEFLYFDKREVILDFYEKYPDLCCCSDEGSRQQGNISQCLLRKCCENFIVYNFSPEQIFFNIHVILNFILSYFIIKGYIANVCVCIMFLNENDLLLTVM
ncbi:LOW QUALITY PROTEIN: hypothetical protein KUTeg_019281 [Tegillarca granosa]|uniref:Uncharacterized protein n=1 Tax=Tegillarca granosa TaxID=220873 RepID=A0ABQ9ECJ1_TEGGR|nr:LOW QUALITY PROTEIN: hypothetical protein KUTeg_019281 [Tegillarca granosa]